MENKNFDFIIIGAGPGGIFAALEMAQMPLKKKVTKPAFRRRVFRCSIGFSLQYSGAQCP